MFSPLKKRLLTGSLILLGLAVSVSPAFSLTEKSDNTSPVFSLTGDARSTAVYSSAESGTGYIHRLRLQSELRPVDSFSFNARIAGWEYSKFDTSDNDTYLVDRFYFDWRNVGASPISLAVGRLPTSGAPGPASLRLGKDSPESRLAPFTDVIIDGGSVHLDSQFAGYDLQFSLYGGTQDDIGYESGENLRGLEETHIYGAQATAERGPNRFGLQLFFFNDLYNVPDEVAFPNPIELGLYQINPGFYDPTVPSRNLILDREPLGNIRQATAFWIGSGDRFDAFFTVGWSRTDPEDIDELGTGLLSSFNINSDNLQSEDGFSVFTGLRYDPKNFPGRVGFEYNYGSKYWIGFQDEDSGKLATRGSVLEIYGLVQPELPGELRRHVRSITGRLGYLYLWYEYTGSGTWLGTPEDIDRLLADPLSAQFFTPVDHDYRLYGAIDISF